MQGDHDPRLRGFVNELRHPGALAAEQQRVSRGKREIVEPNRAGRRQQHQPRARIARRYRALRDSIALVEQISVLISTW